MTRFKETENEYYCVLCRCKHQKKSNTDHYVFRLPNEVLRALGDEQINSKPQGSGNMEDELKMAKKWKCMVEVPTQKESDNND